MSKGLKQPRAIEAISNASQQFRSHYWFDDVIIGSSGEHLLNGGSIAMTREKQNHDYGTADS